MGKEPSRRQLSREKNGGAAFHRRAQAPAYDISSQINPSPTTKVPLRLIPTPLPMSGMVATGRFGGGEGRMGEWQGFPGRQSLWEYPYPKITNIITHFLFLHINTCVHKPSLYITGMRHLGTVVGDLAGDKVFPTESQTKASIVGLIHNPLHLPLAPGPTVFCKCHPRLLRRGTLYTPHWVLSPLTRECPPSAPHSHSGSLHLA